MIQKLKAAISSYLTSNEIRTLFLILLNEEIDLSINNITKEIGLSRDTIKKCLKTLKQKGILKVTKTPGKTNVYAIDWSVLPMGKDTIQ